MWMALLIILVGIPLLLAVLGVILIGIGGSIYNRSVESEKGSARIVGKFSQNFYQQQQQNKGIWESFGVATEQATKPGCLANIFLYPGSLCLMLVKYYYTLLLLPFRLVGRAIRKPFRRS